jgi:hypothetical protein
MAQRRETQKTKDATSPSQDKGSNMKNKLISVILVIT